MFSRKSAPDLHGVLQFSGSNLGDQNIGHQSTVQLSHKACALYTKALSARAPDLQQALQYAAWLAEEKGEAVA